VNVLALVCTLKPSPEPSSADRFSDVLLAAFPGATTGKVRLADVGVARGLQHDMGGGDGWPGVKAQVAAADVLVVVTPIWNGQPSSYFLQVGERLNAMLADSDEQHRTPLYGKVALLGVVGNEDGAHHAGGIGMAMLADLGLSFGPACIAYYLGEDLVEQDEVPQQQREMAALSCSNAAHLAAVLAQQAYPGA
jgi:multimeric flavodoxin WrbA